MHFGKLSVKAHVLSSAQVECISPANILYGNVSLQLSRAGALSEHTEWKFEYENSGVVLGMEPRSGPVQGGTDVTLVGMACANGVLYCSFGSITVVARAMGSSGAICSSPRHGTGRSKCSSSMMRNL